MLPNEEGVAPGAVVEGIYVLPGVPAEMKAMFELVAEAFDGETTHVETVLTSEPESELVDRLRDVQATFDVTVGSYPGDGVRLKLSGTDEDELARAAAWLSERVEPLDDEE
jgi:molybdopterin-biosynthesis enzyme MoeA-like protein